VLQRDSSAQEQLLCKAQQGCGHCLQALRGEEREVKDSHLLEDAEISFEEKTSQPFTQ